MAEPKEQEKNVPAPSAKEAARPVEQVGLRVSLIPEEELNKRDPKVGFKRFVTAGGTVLLLFVLIIAYLGIRVFLDTREVARVNAQTAEYERQLSTLSDSLKNARLTQMRLRSLSSLISSHRNAAPILSFLEKHTLSDVYYTSIAIAENGTVNISAGAATFEAYAAQIAELSAQPEVKKLTSSGLNPVYNPANNALDIVNFTVAVEFDPAIFLVNPKP